MMMRIGETPKAGQRYVHRPGAYAILRRGSDILLTFQERPEPEFQLPGGGVEVGEHPIPALHREIFEETGWRAANLRKLGAFRRFTFMPEYALWAEKLCSIYVGTPVLKLSEPIEKDHHAVWMPMSEAVDALGNDDDRMFLSSLIEQL